MKNSQNVLAQAWILMDFQKGTYIRGINVQDKRQIASLTKMYTLYACLVLNKTLKINPQMASVKIFQSNITGTLAGLQSGRFIRLIDLYYALMLPSGNDAAYLLACYYGSWLMTQGNSSYLLKSYRKQSLSDGMSHVNLYCRKFVQFMNIYIVKGELQHKNTHFENPHGLSDKFQVSTAWELAEAAILFMKHPMFAKISACQTYRGCYVESEQGFEWTNLNELLKEGHIGIKTGYTSSAGGCLASVTSIRLSRFQTQELLVVVLGSESSSSRFSDVCKIINQQRGYIELMYI